MGAKWETPKGGKREFKYYRLTASGKKELLTEHSKWQWLVESIARVMNPAEEG